MVEADAFPVVWLARMRCVAFWLKVMTNPMFEGKSLMAAVLIGDSQEWWRMDEESEKMHEVFWLV